MIQMIVFPGVSDGITRDNPSTSCRISAINSIHRSSYIYIYRIHYIVQFIIPIRTSRSASVSNTEAFIDHHFTLNVNLQIARLSSSMTTLWETMTRNHFKKGFPNKNRLEKLLNFQGDPVGDSFFSTNFAT